MNQRQLDLPSLLGVVDDLDDDGVKAHVLDRGELHVHLSGAIPVSTIQEILADEVTSFPAGLDFRRDMTRLAPCKSLAEYLTPWQVLLLFPKNRANLDRHTHAVLASLAENAVRFVEVCPISNRLTGAVPRDEAHPLQEFLRRGVPFVICSDNPAIHQRGLADDQATAMAEGLSICDMQQQYEVAKRFSFMEGLN